MIVVQRVLVEGVVVVGAEIGVVVIVVGVGGGRRRCSGDRGGCGVVVGDGRCCGVSGRCTEWLWWWW